MTPYVEETPPVVSLGRGTRLAAVVLWHMAGIMLAFIAAFWLRFDFIIPDVYFAVYTKFALWNLLIILAAFSVFRLYSGMWAYFSLHDAFRLAQAILFGEAVFAAVVYVVQDGSFSKFPRSVFIMQPLLLGFWEVGGRFFLRLIRHHVTASRGLAHADRCLIVGAVPEANLLLRSLDQSNDSLGHIVGVVCDDRESKNLRLHGVRVHNTVSDVGRIAKEFSVNSLLITPPYTGPRDIRKILDRCADEEVQCGFRVLPAYEDLALGKVNVNQIRNVEIEDLLVRKPAELDRERISAFVHGRSIMVTGAGGSIGSEICRQVAAKSPSQLILFEFSEYALYLIEGELRAAHPGLNIIACTGDVRRAENLRHAICNHGGVDVIYHAAAYKHVPMMEKNISACFHNNVIGSGIAADIAVEQGVAHFVLVSTDKAVRPTSVMGACKRIAERVVMERPVGGTVFVAVRFGNVLGSSGSVVPLFKKQIENLGPVTVTSPETQRYFMTIPEAVELVMMAGAVSEDRKIMVLEMGEPIKIVDMAKRLIELSGFVPDKDIKIEFIGMRAGEKETEELLTDDEDVERTAYDKIWVFSKKQHLALEPVDLGLISELISRQDEGALRELIPKLVPEAMLAEIDKADQCMV